MSRRMAAMALCMIACLAAMAQQQRTVNIQGVVIDYETSDPVPQVTVQWLQLPDSTFVEGVVTFNNGHFELQKRVHTGSYLLKLSYIGYATQEKPFTVDRKTEKISLDTIQLKSDAIMLKEAIIEAQMADIQMVEDTVMINAENFRVPEGSVLEELLRQIPGVEIADDGSMKFNGRKIDRLLVGGEEFFGNNKDLTTKNLPASMVKRIKNYERKSDLARETGIDDGEEEFVLDLEIKKNMMQGWIGNFDAAYGQPTSKTEFIEELGINNLYSVNAMMNRFEQQQQYSIFANTGNASGRGGAGLTTTSSGGFNMAKNFGENWKKNQYQYKVGGNVNFSTSDGNSQSRSASETYLQNGTSTFSNNWNQGLNGNRRASGDFQFEWRPDTTLSLIFRPNFSYSRGNNANQRRSSTFNADPEATLADLYPDSDYTPLDSAWTDPVADSRVNFSSSASASNNENTSVNASLQLNKRMGVEGRNFTLRANGGYTTSKSISQSTSYTRFYQRGDSTSRINRYSTTPNTSYNFTGRVMWTEPLALATYLQLSYQGSYRYRDNQRSTYDLPDWIPNWDLPEWLWEDEYEKYRSETLSRFSTDEQFNQNIDAQLRRVTDNYNLNVGFSLQPQTRHMVQTFMGVPIDTVRTVFNWTPTVNYRYRWTKQRSLRVNYRGRSQEPELNQLIEVVDDSDPMNISTGNAGLKPTFNNNLRVEFQDYYPEKLRSYNASINVGNTLNSIVNQTTYNEQTGGRITRPTNLDGFWSAWNANGSFNFNTALTNQKFNVSSNTNVGYSHHESYLRTGKINLENPEYPLATTHNYNVSQSLGASYRNEWMDVNLRGNVRYNYAINEMQPEQKQNTWQFNYGPNANFNIPWQNIKISTSINMNSRRGYSSKEFNTNELLWNGQISKSFLPMNAATVSLQFYDILGQQKNVNRNITATGHSDTYNNNINSYFMVHFIYRLNLIGDKQTRREMFYGGMRGEGMGGGQPERMGGPGMRGGLGGFRD